MQGTGQYWTTLDYRCDFRAQPSIGRRRAQPRRRNADPGAEAGACAHRRARARPLYRCRRRSAVVCGARADLACPLMKTPTVPADRIERAILVLRGHKVLLDADLATLYEIPTKRQVAAPRD